MFKIRMDLEMEAGTARCDRRPGRRARASWSRSALRRLRHRSDSRAPGGHAGRPRALRARRASWGSTQTQLLDHLEWMKERGCCAAWPRSSSTAAPASRRTAWACGRCRRSGSWRSASGWPPPRDLALLPAADLRGLALLGVHDGPRPLEGGVRRGPRRDRRRDGLDERATLYSSTEFKKIRLLYFTDEYKRWEGGARS